MLVNFALAAIPIFAMVGLAVDYSRAFSAKLQLQRALDAAVLAVAQDAMTNPSSTPLTRPQLAANILKASLGSELVTALSNGSPCGGATNFESEDNAGNFTVCVQNVPLNTTLLLASVSSLIGRVDAVNLRGSSTATTNGVIGSNKTLEMALALDNTGSMANDMAGLQSAAKTLVNTVIAAANGNAGGNVKISVTPYVAAVNPGITDMTMIDTTAVTPYNGMWMTGGWIGVIAGCTQYWPPSSGGGGGGSSGPGSSGTGDASGDASDLIDLLNPFRKIAGELFGVSSAHAQNATPVTQTPNTQDPIATTAFTDSPPGSGKSARQPVGFNVIPGVPGANGNGGCAILTNPSTISQYDLFARMTSTTGAPVKWKGCVEARPSAVELGGSTDYDVTDAPPSASDPNSLFTPYFWPDEPDLNYTNWTYSAPGSAAGAGVFHNNYLDDDAAIKPPSSSPNDADYASWNWVPSWGSWSSQSILKYNGVNKALIQELGPNTSGPNASCPDAVLRLTPSSTAVINKINNLTYWYNGGTIISEGLMWAWRSLSPNAPYADGKAYGTANNQKVIVLMTDGVNGLADDGGTAQATPNLSDYSAYGYLGAWRLNSSAGVTSSDPVVPALPSGVTVPFKGVHTYDQLQTYFDVRLLKACANAKAKGITIYTVLFNHSTSNALTPAQQAHSLALLQQCASNVNYTYLAQDAAALSQAFSHIGNSVTNARVHLKY